MRRRASSGLLSSVSSGPRPPPLAPRPAQSRRLSFNSGLALPGPTSATLRPAASIKTPGSLRSSTPPRTRCHRASQWWRLDSDRPEGLESSHEAAVVCRFAPAGRGDGHSGWRDDVPAARGGDGLVAVDLRRNPSRLVEKSWTRRSLLHDVPHRRQQRAQARG